MFDMLHSSDSKSDPMDRDNLVHNINIMLVWNKEQTELEESSTLKKNENKDATIEHLEEMMTKYFCW